MNPHLPIRPSQESIILSLIFYSIEFPTSNKSPSSINFKKQVLLLYSSSILLSLPRILHINISSEFLLRPPIWSPSLYILFQRPPTHTAFLFLLKCFLYWFPIAVIANYSVARSSTHASFSVLGIRSPKSVHWTKTEPFRATSFWILDGGICFFAFPASSGWLPTLACGPFFFHQRCTASSILSFLSIFIVTSPPLALLSCRSLRSMVIISIPPEDFRMISLSQNP